MSASGFWRIYLAVARAQHRLAASSVPRIPSAEATAPVASSGGTVTPPVSSGGSATGTSGAATAVTTQIIPGLQAQTPTNVRLQKGDEAVGTGPARAAGQPPDGEKLGRNDPCWCGSGKKFKRCHGAS